MVNKNSAICIFDAMPMKIVTAEEIIEIKEATRSSPLVVFQDDCLSGSGLAQEQQGEIIKGLVL